MPNQIFFYFWNKISWRQCKSVTMFLLYKLDVIYRIRIKNLTVVLKIFIFYLLTFKFPPKNKKIVMHARKLALMYQLDLSQHNYAYIVNIYNQDSWNSAHAIPDSFFFSFVCVCDWHFLNNWKFSKLWVWLQPRFNNLFRKHSIHFIAFLPPYFLD